jgi:hypothetical protein
MPLDALNLPLKALGGALYDLIPSLFAKKTLKASAPSREHPRILRDLPLPPLRRSRLRC